MTGSIYADVMVSNERAAVISIRPLTAAVPCWAYEVLETGLSPQRGSITTTTDPTPLQLVSAVLLDWQERQPSSDL